MTTSRKKVRENRKRRVINCQNKIKKKKKKKNENPDFICVGIGGPVVRGVRKTSIGGSVQIMQRCRVTPQGPNLP